MQYFHEEMMKRLIEDRQASVIAVMAQSKRRSVIMSRFGLMLIRLGEKLRQDAPPSGRVLSVERSSRSRPGLI